MNNIFVLVILILLFVSCQKNTATKHCQSYPWLDEFQTSGTIAINGFDFPYSLSKFQYSGAINFIDLSTCSEIYGYHSFIMNNLKTNDTTILSAFELTQSPSILFAHRPVSVYDPSCLMIGHETIGGYAYLEMIDSNNFNLNVKANLRFRDSTKCEFQQQFLDSMHVQMNLSFKHN